MLLKLYRLLIRQKRIPPLNKSIRNPDDNRPVNDDQSLLMVSRAAKDPEDADALLREYAASNATDVVPHLPPRPRPNIRRRFLNWLRRLEGTSEHNPENAMLRELRHGKTQIRIQYRFRSEQDT